jgi:hypothetical protein
VVRSTSEPEYQVKIIKPSSNNSLSKEAQEVMNLPDKMAESPGNSQKTKLPPKTSMEMLAEIKEREKKKKEDLARVNNKKTAAQDCPSKRPAWELDQIKMHLPPQKSKSDVKKPEEDSP